MDIVKDAVKDEVIPTVHVDVVKDSQAEDAIVEKDIKITENAAEQKDEIHSAAVDIVKGNQDKNTTDG